MVIKSPLQIEREEHDEALLAKKTSLVSAATIYAVVNSGTGGTSSTDDAVFNVGVDAGTPFMALADDTSPDSVNEGDVGVVRMTLNRWLETKMESAATLYAVVNTGAAGDTTNKIGFATVHQGDDPWRTSFSGNVTLDDGSLTGIVGNVTLSDAKTFIGLTTTTLGASPAFVGIVTIANASLPVSFSGNVTLDDGSLTGIVGNVTLDQGSIVQIGDGGWGIAAIHLTHGDGQANTLNALIASGFLYGFNGTTWDRLRSDTTNGLDVDVTRLNGNVTLSDAKTYIGLVTATSLNAGTTKTFLHRKLHTYFLIQTQQLEYQFVRELLILQEMLQSELH